MASVADVQLSADLNLSPTTCISQPSNEDVIVQAALLAKHLTKQSDILSRVEAATSEHRDAFTCLQELNFRIDADLILSAPRRKAADPTDAALAARTANMLHPSFPADSLAPVIRYEKLLVKLRELAVKQRVADKDSATIRNAEKEWPTRIMSQGPWDPETDPVSLGGAPSLPMPVQIAEKEELVPFFAHLAADKTVSTESSEAEFGEEPYYKTKLIEFQKGVLYEDRRMDLCKMVLGPTHIEDLMKSLELSTFTRHFLLGNNIIGPVGAKAIASFVKKYPERMETWYLAGNCIGSVGLHQLVDSFITSSTITNIWLKRNPLMPDAVEDIFRLITETENLRTLDLDQTEIGDSGVTVLFTKLTERNRPIRLRNIYLNAVGIGPQAASAIGEYLASSNCSIDSMYLSNNPLGNAGCIRLAIGLATNKSLLRISLQSVGLADAGAQAIVEAASNHPTLMLLDLGQGYATEDLEQRYNWITDFAVPSIVSLIESSTPLKYLNIGSQPLKTASISQLLAAVAKSNTLCYYLAKSVLPPRTGPHDYGTVKILQELHRLTEGVKQVLHANVKRYFGMDYDAFNASEKRFLVSPKDVRFIDSVYRNRDAGMARRGLMRLKKLWDEGDETLNSVMNAVGPICGMRKKEEVKGAVGPTCTRKKH